MLPDGVLSDKAYVGAFTFPVKTAHPDDLLQDWELGGVYLNDASTGLMVKLWHLRREIDRDTDICSVIVSAPGGVAPGEPERVLFTGLDITEVALAFDQNMNPFVAYTQGSDCKFWWYDPTIPGMTHTTLPAGSKTAKCTLDDKRLFNVGDSDILLAYIRAGMLCIRYQRERYVTEHVLKSGVGADAELLNMAMNTGSRIQFRIRNYALMDDPQALRMVRPFLGDVVIDLCRRAGLKPEEIDVTELYDDILPGMKVEIDEGFEKPLAWLQDMFWFDKSVYDKKIHFPKRGRDPVAWIPYDHLIDGNPVALEQVRADESKLPILINLTHIDPDAGYAKNKQTAGRRSNLIKAKAKKTIESGLVLTRDQAATVAVQKLKVEWNELITYKFATTLRYSFLTVADVVMVEDARGTWHRIRLQEKNEDQSEIEWEGKQDAGARAYKMRGVAGSQLAPPVSTTPGEIGETRLEILNISPERDQDDELGVYIAAAGGNSAWQGYTLQYSIDGGISFRDAYTSESAATLGDTLTDLLAEPGYLYPSSQTVEVTTNFSLTSINQDQLLAGENKAVIGDEVIQFQTATFLGMVGTLYHYRLSGLVRGRSNTEAEHWNAGTRFVLIDNGVIFVQLQRSMIGIDMEYKAVSVGLTADETSALLYLFDQPYSQKEWPVAATEVTRVGGDVTVSFIGRARLGSDGNPYHSKYFRGFRITFSDGVTQDTYNTTVTRPSTPGGVTVKICALNDITGEGPYTPDLAT